jgi:hypothetical protein
VESGVKVDAIHPTTEVVGSLAAFRVDAVAEEMVRLIQHYHPKLVEEVGSE